jgi:hypothetical protein
MVPVCNIVRSFSASSLLFCTGARKDTFDGAVPLVTGVLVVTLGLIRYGVQVRYAA